MADSLRESFEKWILEWGPAFDREPADPDCGTFAAVDTEDCWQSWQAGYRAGASEMKESRDELLKALRGLVYLTDQGREGGLILSRYDRKPITNADQDVIDRAYIAAESAITKTQVRSLEVTK